MSELRLGKREPVNKASIRFGDVWTGRPVVPTEVDYLAIGGWEMLGNDQYGDCVAVTWANQRRLLTRMGATEQYPNLDQVLALYRTQNPGFPGEDNGMSIQDCLSYLVTQGGPDGVKAVAFARIDEHNEDEVRAALAIFGCLWVGVQVQQSNMGHDVPNGTPWDYYRSKNIGGHSVIVGGYDSDNLGGDQTMVTWGAHTSMTDAYWSHQVDEVWCVVWPEHLGTRSFMQGVDVQALAAAYKALTGRTLDLPTPTPASPPEPHTDVTETPSAADRVLWHLVQVWTEQKHSRLGGVVADALRRWAASKGLIA